ncbi:hypothetical protein KIN20_032224 [Parelaphostrongylus tenuis]|uniref:Uncharacterized protein n=1 Tax=Parelaphostrongylus tenuis TaxID=148309 RepID=A0AAD5R6N0_PARTN|nr:hypothetical protein KIN20_032224 [Parelaphostrongylus tenuis]
MVIWAGIYATGEASLASINVYVKFNAAGYQQQVLRSVLEPWSTKHLMPAVYLTAWSAHLVR